MFARRDAHALGVAGTNCPSYREERCKGKLARALEGDVEAELDDDGLSGQANSSPPRGGYNQHADLASGG